MNKLSLLFVSLYLTLSIHWVSTLAAAKPKKPKPKPRPRPRPKPSYRVPTGQELTNFFDNLLEEFRAMPTSLCTKNPF